LAGHAFSKPHPLTPSPNKNIKDFPDVTVWRGGRFWKERLRPSKTPFFTSLLLGRGGIFYREGAIAPSLSFTPPYCGSIWGSLKGLEPLQIYSPSLAKGRGQGDRLL
jgi:hypothetical protein